MQTTTDSPKTTPAPSVGSGDLLAAFRAKITTIKSKGKVIGYNVRRDGHLIAGPFERRSDAIRWGVLAYGSREQTANTQVSRTAGK